MSKIHFRTLPINKGRMFKKQTKKKTKESISDEEEPPTKKLRHEDSEDDTVLKTPSNAHTPGMCVHAAVVKS